MKRFRSLPSTLAIVSVFLSCNLQAVESLPFYENFPTSYGDGASLNSAPANTIWAVGGGAGNGTPTNYASAALSYPGLQPDGSGSLGLLMPNIASGTRNRGLNFTAVSSGTLYASFLLDVVTAPSANRLIATLTSDSSQSASTSVVGVTLNASSQLAIGKNSSSTIHATTTGSVLAAGNANLVVLRYTFDAAGADEFALWLNPSGGSLGAGAAPAPDIFTTSGTDLADLEWFFLSQRNNTSVAGSILKFDELRIGTSWASVTPVPEPATFAIAGVAAFALVCYRRSRR